MPDYKLNIIGTFNNKQLVKALRQAGVDVDKLGKKTKKTNEDLGRFRQATGGMRRTLGAVRNNLLLVSFAFGTIGAAIGKTVKDFAKFEKVNIGFQELGKSVGFSSAALNKLKQATDGTVSSMELMKQANNAMLLGIVESEDQMADMFDIAQRLASAVGQDATFGIESLTTGIGRQSRLMLDNLGIIVKSDEAYKSYAKQINKTVSELTEQERKTAFINAAMDAARDKVEKLGDEQETVSMTLSAASASIGELSIALGKVFSPAVEATAKKITEWAEGLRMLVYEFNILRGIELEETEMLALLDKKITEQAGAYAAWQRNLENTGVIMEFLSSKSENLGMTYHGLSARVDILTQQYLDMLKVGESIEKSQEVITEEIGQTSLALADLYPGMVLALSMYQQTKQAQIELIESQMALIVADSFAMENQEGMEDALEKMGGSYDLLAEKLLNLISTKKKDAKESKTQLQANSELAKGSAALLKQFAGGYKAAARLQQTAAAIDAWSAANAAIAPPPKGYGPSPIGWTMYAASLASGMANVMAISKSIGEFKTAATGMDEVVSRPTMILAGEAGPESVNITPLNAPNDAGGGGGSPINVSIQGNVMTDQFVEEELSEKIAEAVRRGVDFGIS